MRVTGLTLALLRLQRCGAARLVPDGATGRPIGERGGHGFRAADRAGEVLRQPDAHGRPDQPRRQVAVVDRAARRRAERLGRRRSANPARREALTNATGPADPQLLLGPGFVADPVHPRQGRRRELPALRGRRGERRSSSASPRSRRPAILTVGVSDHDHGPDPDRPQQPRSALARRAQPRPQDRRADAGA